jgi:CBS domain-containing protein
LRRKGLEWERENQRAGTATEKTIGDVMREPVAPLRETTPFREIAHRFLGSSNNFLPVVDVGQKLIGVVALQDLKEHLNAGSELAGVIAIDVMRPPPPSLTPNQHLIEALPLLLASQLEHVPVVSDPRQCRLVGSVIRGEVLSLFREALATRAVGRL